MRTTWAKWDLEAVLEAAELEGYAGLSALKTPERDLIATLPYYPAFNEYRDHVVACADCRRDDLTDCPEGEALRATARVGLDEQAVVAAKN